MKIIASVTGNALLVFSCALCVVNRLPAQDLPPLPPAVDLPLVEILATDPTALVGTSSGAFTVVRTGATTENLVVKYGISGTAANGIDYSQLATEVTIPAGFLARDILISPIGDSPNHGNKTVTLTLQTNVQYKLHAHQRASLTLVDDAFSDLPPAVTLTSPVDGAVIKTPAVVSLLATATDPDDKVLKVTFYANDRSLGRATNSPYTLLWTNPPSGSYALFARAEDPRGKSTLSAPIHIRVTNVPPVVKILSPAADASLSVPTDVKIEAEATDTDDSVATVRIYGDGKLLTTLSKSPYVLTWTNVPPGKHTVVVRATDELGTAASATVQFSVHNKAPAIKLVSPTDGANFPAHPTITLRADASDTDGTITRVSFWENGHYLGAVKKAPYTLDWKTATAGVHSLKAVATDNYGAMTTSSAVLISVSK